MKTYNAGKFVVEVADDGWPCWITLKAESTNGEKVEVRIHPDEMPDLQHVLDRAAAHAAMHMTTPQGLA